MKSGANFVGDVLAGKNDKKATKACALEAANVAKKKAVNKLMNQTGSGKRGSKQAAKKTAKRSIHIYCQKQADQEAENNFC